VDVVGQPFIADLTQMPHVLVAGATGSGKSVCLNSIITGLLFQHDPKTLQMIMIDPKMLELSAYNGIRPRHAVITQPKRAAGALGWAVREMEKRYNSWRCAGRATSRPTTTRCAPDRCRPRGGARTAVTLGFLVVVIDELADLMLTVPAEIEEPIARWPRWRARSASTWCSRPSVLGGRHHRGHQGELPVPDRVPGGLEDRLAHGPRHERGREPAGPRRHAVHARRQARALPRPRAFVSEEETARWSSSGRPGRFRAPRRRWRPSRASSSPPRRARPGRARTSTTSSSARPPSGRHPPAGLDSLLQRRLKVGIRAPGASWTSSSSSASSGHSRQQGRDVLVDERWLEDRFE